MLHDQGHSLHEICNKTGCSKTAWRPETEDSTSTTQLHLWNTHNRVNTTHKLW